MTSVLSSDCFRSEGGEHRTEGGEQGTEGPQGEQGPAGPEGTAADPLAVANLLTADEALISAVADELATTHQETLKGLLMCCR